MALSRTVEELLRVAARAWHEEHPDPDGPESYGSAANAFRAMAERVFCAEHPRLNDPREHGVHLPNVERGRHVLYYAYDSADGLLYVGITNHFAARMSAHERRAVWWRFASYVSVHECPDRVTAEWYESTVILGDAPPFNVAGRP